MSAGEVRTPGAELADQVFDALRHAESALAPDARDLYVIRGVTANRKFTRPQENVLSEIGHHLAASQRVFAYGNSIVMEVPTRDGSGQQLVTLASNTSAESGAHCLLANLFVCEASDGLQFPVPSWLADLLLGWEPLPRLLPRITYYGSRAIFDADFVLRGPGWHEDVGILIHGPDLDPVMRDPADPSVPPLDRLPRRLRELLGEFCFRDSADLVNTVGLMLTGLLANHFVECGKAMALLDGNQPGLGKTLLGRVLGVVLDGIESPMIHHSADDEELTKRICATLREGTRSVLLFDNARAKAGGRVASAVLESNSVAPHLRLRILTRSENLSVPNGFLWLLTMNDTRVSPDLVSRALPIRLHLEGRPEGRRLRGDPIAYARDHRLEILGELAGMVVRWNQQGRPEGCQRHRLARWAHLIGGILATAGFPEFLGNYQSAATTFDADRDDLAAVMETILRSDGARPGGSTDRDGGVAVERSRGRPASDLVDIFIQARVTVDELETTRSARGRAVKVAHFLGAKLGQDVPVEVNGRCGVARLESETARARQRSYFVQVAWDSSASGCDAVDGSPGPDPAVVVPALPAIIAATEQMRPRSEGPPLPDGNGIDW